MEHTVKGDAPKSAGTEHTTRTVHVSGTEHHTEHHAEHHKRRRTSSKGARRLTEIDRRVSKAVRRVTRAVDNGVDSYIEHRDKSADSRRDGPIVDFVENVSYGVSKTVSEASPILHDIAEAWNTRRMRSQMRRFARSFGSIPFLG
jgi:hypothetical protein